MKSVWYYDYPVGCVGIVEERDAISHIFFRSEGALSGCDVVETPLIQKAAAQLEEYYNGTRERFDLPLSLSGTSFEQSVWEALRTIPPGETRSYKDIAVQIGHPKANRAVGRANHKNPVVIVIPCHRVVGQNGSLHGYVGGLSAKRYLLELESRHA